MSFKDLNIDVIDLPLIGEKRRAALATVGVRTLEDLLYYVPRAYLDRSSVKPIGQLVVGEECTVIGVVQRIRLVPTKKRKILKVEIMDNSGILTLNWFHGSEWIQKTFQQGDTISVYGKVEFYRGNTMTHPDFDIIDPNKDALNTGGVIPVYPLTQELRRSGLTSRSFRKLFAQILDTFSSDFPDPFPENLMQHEKLMSFSKAIHQMHFPESTDMLEKARYRFKFQEALMLQTLVAVKRMKIKEQNNRVKCEKAGELLKEMYDNLPFEPTNAQKRVLKEIYADLKTGTPMNRLLQGDVGCGKTLVAAMAAAIMTANGYQTAIMAPTEILANQHFEHFKSEFDRLRVPCCLLTGKTTKKQRDIMLGAIKSGQIPIVIGTHALIQEDVEFQHLGLVIIDEQHRFGVDQRGALIKKGPPPHTLAMTATPIPRTLSMTLYGDMDVSIIDEMPEGRIPVRTKVVSPSRLPGVYDFFEKEMSAGRQIYVVYPLIAESEKMDIKAAEKGYIELKERFGKYQIALLHGKTKKDEKNEIMRRFMENKIKLLVSTTVIEVGVNNPNASVMLIENAERFGLSQLHQLRGRVGRGGEASWCILVQGNRSSQSEERLMIMEKTHDGFVISEEDLKQRGQGDVFGSRQHGLPDLKFLHLYSDKLIMEKARATALKMIESDKHLLKPVNAEFKRYFLAHYSDKLDYAGIG